MQNVMQPNDMENILIETIFALQDFYILVDTKMD